ncbi:hypothetical protein [Dokdonella koreensis]|uniref:Outer membrane protein assembly factor BamC n=1 Tax=Dokdonella koreensis DS-123 TaxID=1300342 RepID=A0A167H391_9GAMM|nr:hypothetical protein [Dokdonella koreensis]ANB18696.1 Hypothetical protein I596_2701 [Dokdonella koreensis DS-123]
MKRTIALLMLLPLLLLAGGCKYFSRESAKDEYKRAVESRPLEVPPDLDAPANSGAMVIPEARPSASSDPAGSVRREDGALVLGAPPAGDTSATAEPPPVSASPGVKVGGEGLLVSDSVESTWRRVGLALQRSGAATVVASDEATSSYDVETAGEVVSKPGWFKRTVTLGMAKDKVSAPVRLKIRVSGEGEGSRVSIEGADDEAGRAAADGVLAALRQRLS